MSLKLLKESIVQIPLYKQFIYQLPKYNWGYCNEAAINYFKDNKQYKGMQYIKAEWSTEKLRYIYPKDKIQII